MPNTSPRLRRLLIAVAVLVTVVAVGFALMLHSGVQTWAAQRYLRNHPELGVSVGRVDIGLRETRLEHARASGMSYQVSAPAIRAKIDLLAWLFSDKLTIREVEAHGVEVLARSSSPPAAAGRPKMATPAPATDVASRPVTAGSSTASAPAPMGFAGIFPGDRLPFDLILDRADLDGTIQISGARLAVTVTGGNVGVGRAGPLDVQVRASLRGGEVRTVAASAVVTVRMDSPRSFSEIAALIKATAQGDALAQPVLLQARVGASRTATDEAYAISVEQGGRQLASIDARLAAATHRLTGKWQLDVRDGDLAPFALGRSVPTFATTGQGSFDTGGDLSAWNVAGVLDAHVDGLGMLVPKLSSVGALRLISTVDLASNDGVMTVSKLDVALAREKSGAPATPVALIQALQPFEIEPHTYVVRPSDPEKDLVAVTLQQLPLSWVQPFLGQTEVSGSDATGQLVATPRAGGFTFRTKAPLALDNLSVHQAGQPLVRELAISVSAAGDFTPRGWQTEVNAVAGQGTAKSLWLHAKAGKLAGDAEPVKATGLVTLDLGAATAQPFAREWLALKGGDASMEFSASVGASQQLQAVIGLENLVTAGPNPLPLADLSTTLRADLAADGRIDISAPVVLQAGDRRSDVTIAGWLHPRNGGGTFEAKLASDRLVVEDAKAYAAVLVADPEPTPPEAPPAWAHWSGALALDCKSLLYTGAFELTNVTGTIRLHDGAVKFEQVRAAVGSGMATAEATLAVEHEIFEPFRLDADVALRDFDPGPLFQSVNPRQPPTVSGRFAVSTKLQARSTSLAALPGAAMGDIHVTSRGGVFRGLPVNVGNLVENSSKLAGWLAAAGDAIKSSFVGKRDFEEITSRSQAANELARMLSLIEYDQLSMRISQEGPFHARVKEFTLISPELRLTGSGLLRRGPGEAPLTELVEMDLRVSARGRAAELMKYLGVLDQQVDPLGYAACTLPIRVEGALDQLDTTQLSNRLVALAVEKTGLTEKALDWINRLRGKGTN